jgi:phospholipid/cholesterol/gamma-HCH transport system substrate-binding protein
MLVSVDSVLTALQTILNKNSVGDIKASFSSIRSTLETLDGSARKLDDMLARESSTISATLDNLNRVSRTLADNNVRITHIFTNVDSLTTALNNGQLQKTLADLSAASAELKSLMTQMGSGEGTLGLLLKDDSLYHNLNNASAELDLLLEDLRVNPNRYFSVFGKKDKLPKLSDADIKRIQEAMKKQGP